MLDCIHFAAFSDLKGFIVPKIRLEQIKFTPKQLDDLDELGDRLAAALFLIGSSWHEGKLTYPGPEAWNGFNLMSLDGTLVKYAKYLK